MPHADKTLSDRSDLTLLASADDTHMLIGGDEQQSAIASYVARYGQNAKLTGNVNRRLWMKV